MATLKEKVSAYVGRIIVKYWHDKEMDFDVSQFKVLGKECRDAYLAGAKEALASQWRKSDNTEDLQDGEQVIVAIQRTDNSIKYFYAAYFQDGKFWYDSDGSEVHLFNLWMRLPEPPKILP